MNEDSSVESYFVEMLLFPCNPKLENFTYEIVLILLWLDILEIFMEATLSRKWVFNASRIIMHDIP